ncbi:MAG: ATP-binding protein [Solirubrobacterales bacterium]|nr:ATP-binding protein [Solirubrobacterales bacterium]
MIITSNKRVSGWAELFGDEVQAVAVLDRLLHDGRDPHHQRPFLAAPRPRRPPPPGRGECREQREQPDRYPSEARARAAEGLT